MTVRAAVTRTFKEDPVRSILALGVFVVAVAGAAVLLIPGIESSVDYAFNAVTYPVAGLGSGLLMIAFGSRARERGRWGWILVGAGFACWGVGEVLWQYYVIVGQEIPYPGPADVFYIAGYPLIGAGVLLLPHVRPGRYERVRLSLDAAAGSLAAIAVAWFVYLGDSVSLDPGAGFLENWINVSYPIGDLFLLAALMVLVLRRSELHFDPRLLFIGIALAATTIADVIYLMQAQADTYIEGDPLDAVWLVAYAAVVVAAFALLTPITVSEQTYRPPRTWQLVVPYAAVTALFALTLGQVSGASTFLQWTTTVVAGLIISRQGVAIKENRELIEQQRDDLVASVSHELRTPLTAVQGYAQLLDSSWDLLDDAEKREMVRTVERQATHLGRLVTDLIEVTRDRLNDTRLNVEAVDIARLTSDVISDLQAAGQAPARVTSDLASFVADVDPDRIRQVIANLLTNAARYGNGVIHVTVESMDDSVAISVDDNGDGVPKKFESMIWERFERGEHRFDQSIPGSGIGLPVAKALVEAHGGSIRYDTSPELRGARFTITLPRHPTSNPRIPDQSLASPRVVPT